MNALTRLACRFLVLSGAASLSLKRLEAGSQPSLTILAYHRIGRSGENPTADPSLFSASAEGFSWQMSFLQRYFTVLSFEEVLDRRKTGASLPPNAALVTFDDGYRDNYEIAYPILRKKGLSAAIFLVTGMVGSTSRMWWDEAAALLTAVTAAEIELPGIGRACLRNGRDRASAAVRLRRAWKPVAAEQRERYLQHLRGLIDPALLPLTSTVREYMNWEEAREMRRGGVAFGAHTHTHPILTHVTLPEAEAEISRSQKIIDDALPQPYRLFAYPNGGPDDFDGSVRGLLAAHRFDAAVTLLRGRNLTAQSGTDWLALRRIYIGGGDDRAVFAAKVSGLLDGAASAPAALARTLAFRQAQR